MKNIIFIYPHQGVGDHMVCNGLVRELTEQENAALTYLVVRKQDYNTISRMYSDDKGIYCLPMENYTHGNHQIPLSLPQVKLASKVFQVGFEACCRGDWDVSFYDCVNIPFEKRWSSFKCNRNLEREAKLESIVNPNNESFILVHDEQAGVGRFPIEINTNLKVIRVEKISTSDGWSDCLVDWYGLIEKAKEVHCISSSVIHFASSIGRDGVFHDFGRCDFWGGKFVLPESWKVVDERWRIKRA